MGQTLSEPVTTKESAYCQNEMYRVGSSCMQGWRVNMEDSHTHILSLPDDPGTSFFAVYDGHGGAQVAQYAGKHLHKFVLRRPEYKDNLELALKKAFLDIDYEMQCNEQVSEQMAGSTAVVVVVKDSKLFCANAGDSRAIACINGEVDVLSMDHKPNNEEEAKRIVEGGGWIEFNRVNGNLALSRALGDFVFKRNAAKKPEEQIVTAYPDVERREITRDWEFIVLACDGIWDVMTNKEVVDFCRKRIGMGMYPEEICEELMNHCLAPDCQMGGLGGDNMTVVLVCLLHNEPYEELIARCAKSSNSLATSSDEENAFTEKNNDRVEANSIGDSVAVDVNISSSKSPKASLATSATSTAPAPATNNNLGNSESIIHNSNHKHSDQIQEHDQQTAQIDTSDEDNDGVGNGDGDDDDDDGADLNAYAHAHAHAEQERNSKLADGDIDGELLDLK